MLAAPPTVAKTPESATTALYRAALGPANTAHYLAVFERFDEAGRASPVWNTAAGLLSINWMVFRQLWGAALAYVVCMGGLVLLTIGPGRRFLQWPPAVEWGVLAALLLVSIVIPGVYGNALLHADTRRRITRAVLAAKTVREACAALEKQAASTRRRSALVWINVALLAAALAVGLAQDPRWRTWAVARDIVAVVTPAEAVAPVVVVPPAPAPLPEVVPEQAEALRQPEAPTAALVTVSTATSSAPAPVVEPPPPEPPSAPAAGPAPEPLPARATASIPQAHGINVGLFADKANAEKAHARLIEAGLPAILQTAESPKGPLTRVRVGPFGSRTQADEVAARIRAMGLDAVVFRP